jgi:cell division protein ZapA (FtsZ GTPase activity inhibitor)
MSAADESAGGSVEIKILGHEYRLKSDADPEHLQTVASYVDSVLRELRQSTTDTQDAAILAALNIASELLRIRKAHEIVSRARSQALIDFVDSA